ncbi:acyl transferase/acyl hydrolase/lysophospholipase [Rostrohypoxylon terebratum]|nr:acyl transferase/acyl hydrolase/lysophospholipase [Rostrohypoxylon terebratum]
MMARANVLGGLDRPPRLLSLDGGGIRGKSSLLILENIMERVRDAQNLDHVPKPCDIFDLIGGTSTGGIIAIMLGRLGMSVDECIRVYDRVAEAAFAPKRRLGNPLSSKGAFSSNALATVIKQVVRDFCTDDLCVARRSRGKPTTNTCDHVDLEFRSRSCTKTVVLAITKENVNASPTILSTYDTSTHFQDCTIWEVARATSAATTFFDPIELGRDKIKFIDAAFGFNNPCRVLLAEAQRQFPQYRQDQIYTLSIGTGLDGVANVGKSLVSVVRALKDMATSSRQVATDMSKQYGEQGCYHRFNVDRGLDDITLSDWKKKSKISAHTRNYLAESQRDDLEVDSIDSLPRSRDPRSDVTSGCITRIVTILHLIYFIYI